MENRIAIDETEADDSMSRPNKRCSVIVTFKR